MAESRLSGIVTHARTNEAVESGRASMSRHIGDLNDISKVIPYEHPVT